MKLLPVIFCLCLYFSAIACGQTLNDNYDSTLAKSLNADEYGMKYYFMVLLKPGSNASGDKEAIDAAFDGHMKNMNRLAEEGTLVIAGPMVDNDAYEGIFVLNAENTEEANALLQTDPAIAGNFLDYDLYKWYSSAALQETMKIHKKIGKYSF